MMMIIDVNIWWLYTTINFLCSLHLLLMNENSLFCVCQNYASLLHLIQFKVNEHGFLLLLLLLLWHVLFATRNKNKNNSFIRNINLMGIWQKLSEVSSITQKPKKSNLYKILNPPSSSLSITLSNLFSSHIHSTTQVNGNFACKWMYGNFVSQSICLSHKQCNVHRVNRLFALGHWLWWWERKLCNNKLYENHSIFLYHKI